MNSSQEFVVPRPPRAVTAFFQKIAPSNTDRWLVKSGAFVKAGQVIWRPGNLLSKSSMSLFIRWSNEIISPYDGVVNYTCEDWIIGCEWNKDLKAPESFISNNNPSIDVIFKITPKNQGNNTSKKQHRPFDRMNNYISIIYNKGKHENIFWEMNLIVSHRYHIQQKTEEEPIFLGEYAK